MTPSLTSIKTAYFIGIKGVGMTALAQIFHDRGVRVSGSDTHEQFFTDDVLKRLRIRYYEGFRKSNIPHKVDVVIVSAAYFGTKNSEVQEVKRRGVPIFFYPDALAELFNNAYGIAVCGSHGKSTTTAMLGFILEYAGFDPTVLVGSRVNQWHSNARAGSSNYFVIEADEYRDAFLHYWPKMIMLTNIDYDHPDYFSNPTTYRASFTKFLSRVPVSKRIQGSRQKPPLQFKLQLPGIYNQTNAYLAYRAAQKLGISASIARKALQRFSGLTRRFEYYGTVNGARLYDDYAHHPTEIHASIAGARELFPNRKIIVLFQPHTFTRTQRFFNEFVQALGAADEVFILKTYSSVRERGEDKEGKRLALELKTHYFKTHSEATRALRSQLHRGIILCALGAGDGWRVLNLLKKKFKHRGE